MDKWKKANNAHPFGKCVRRIRRTQLLTQTDVAKMLDVSTTYICRIEINPHAPDDSMVKKFLSITTDPSQKNELLLSAYSGDYLNRVLKANLDKEFTGNVERLISLWLSVDEEQRDRLAELLDNLFK